MNLCDNIKTCLGGGVSTAKQHCEWFLIWNPEAITAHTQTAHGSM